MKGDRERKSRGNKIHLEFWLNQSYFSVKKSRQQSMSQDEGGVYSKRKMRARQCRKVSWVKLRYTRLWPEEGVIDLHYLPV